MVNRVLLFFVFMAVLGLTVSHGQNGFITYPPSTGGGGGSGPCVLTGSQTTGFVLTATDNSLGCSWQAAGAATIDNNSLKAAVYCADSGGANTITCPISSYPATFSSGQQVVVKVNTTSTGPTTIVITNSGGALASKAVTRNGAAAIAAGNHVAGRPYLLVYDGVEFVSVTFTPVSGVDFAPATSGSAILKGSGTGGFSNAVSATDYAPATTGTSILKASAGGFANAVSATDYAPATSGTSILKASAGGFANAVSGTDYAPATSGTSILKALSGGFANAVGGTDYEFPLTFSAPLSRATNTISCITATGSVAGCLSAADWTTFNSKQNALTNPLTGTGTNTQVAYFTGATSVSSNANFTVDTSGNVVANSFSGSGSGASYLELPQTTAPGLGTTSIRFYAPTSVTSQARSWASAPFTGVGLWTNSSGVMAETALSMSGSGTILCLATSCAMTTPNLGIPSAVTLTNGTGLPIAGITGLGTGVGTWLAAPSSTNLLSAVTGATGTGALVFGTGPTITLANGTGLPISTGVSGLGTGIATWLAGPSSANLLAALTTKTGTGLSMFGTGPTASGLTLSDVATGTQCLHANGSGVVSGTGSDCTASSTGSAGTVQASNGSGGFSAAAIVDSGGVLTISEPMSLGSTTTARGFSITATANGTGVTANLIAAKDTSNPVQYQTAPVGGCGSGIAASTATSGNFELYVVPGTVITMVADGTVTATHFLTGGAITGGRVADTGQTGRQSIPDITCLMGVALESKTVGQNVLVKYEGVGIYGAQTTKDIGVTFDAGDGSALSGTSTRCMSLDYAATIRQATLIGDVSGSATIDVKTVAYTSYTGPASASSITAAAIPTLSSAVKSQDATLTGWTTALAAGTEVCFVLSSPATVQWVNATLKVTVP